MHCEALQSKFTIFRHASKKRNALQCCLIFHQPTGIAQMHKDWPLIRRFSVQIAGNHLGNFSVFQRNKKPESSALEDVRDARVGVRLVPLVGLEAVAEEGGEVLVHGDRLQGSNHTTSRRLKGL